MPLCQVDLVSNKKRNYPQPIEDIRMRIRYFWGAFEWIILTSSHGFRLDGCSFCYAHIWSKSGISICWKHLVTSKESSNSILFPTCFELPFYLSTMIKNLSLCVRIVCVENVHAFPHTICPRYNFYYLYTESIL